MNIGLEDVGLSISAAGTTQGTATLLINGFNQITTAAVNSGVSLYPALVGASQLVFNGATNAVKVYPPLGMQINSLPVNTGHSLPPNTTCRYYFLSGTLIAAILSA